MAHELKTCIHMEEIIFPEQLICDELSGKWYNLDNDIERLNDITLRDRVINYFKDLGFRFVTIDLEGYRMGSFNYG